MCRMTVLKILLLHLLCFNTEAKLISLEDKMSLTISVANYFRSGCVFILGSSDRNIRGLKLLSARQVPAIILPAASRLRDTTCQMNRPVVTIDGHEDTMASYQLPTDVHLSDYTWLLFLNADTSLDNFFNNFDIPFDCEFLIARLEDDNNFVLTEVYRVSMVLPVQMYRFGTWSREDGSKFPVGSFYHRRSDLQGLVLKTGHLKDKWRIDISENRKWVSKNDFYLDIWNQLEKIMNFTTEYHTPRDDALGEKCSSGSWTGLIGMLQEKELDVSNAFLGITASRLDVVDFTVPLFNLRSVLVIRKPSRTFPIWNAFLLPFSRNLWVAVIICMVLCAACHRITSRLQCQGSAEDVKFNTDSFLIIGVFCMQGQGRTCRPTTVRITLLTSFLTAVVLVSSYSAGFFTYLAVQTPKMPFNDFKQLLEDGTFKLGMMHSSAQLDYFKNSKVGMLREIYKRLIKPHESTLATDFEGLQRVCYETKYAHLIPSYTLHVYERLSSCALAVVPDASFPGCAAIVTTKRSPYRALFNYRLQTMRRDGTLAGIYNRYSWTSLSNIEIPTICRSVQDVTSNFIILIIGIFISVAIFLIEVTVVKYKCRRFKGPFTMKLKRKRECLQPRY